MESQTDLARGAGGYLSLRFGDDGKVYSGAHADEQVFVVGKGTEHERSFAQSDLQGASNHARRWRLALITQSAGALPNRAMRDLFEEPEAPD